MFKAVTSFAPASDFSFSLRKGLKNIAEETPSASVDFGAALIFDLAHHVMGSVAGAGSVLTFFANTNPKKKCSTDPDAPPSLTGYWPNRERRIGRKLF